MEKIAFGKTLLQSAWNFTLHVRKCHNEEVHGQGKYSANDIASLKKCVIEIYEKLRAYVSEEDEWLFNKSEINIF